MESGSTLWFLSNDQEIQFLVYSFYGLLLMSVIHYIYYGIIHPSLEWQSSIKLLTRSNCKLTDWSKIEQEFTALDLINVLQGFKLDPDRKKWVEDLLNKRLKEEGLDPVTGLPIDHPPLTS